jgi:hypothetical protein
VSEESNVTILPAAEGMEASGGRLDDPARYTVGAGFYTAAVPTVFVAYPYRISAADYRSAYREVGERFGVEFQYADEQITNQHVLVKIEEMMDAAEFSLFDITYWNPNVSLELGLAIGKGLGYYILWNPTAEHDQPPADIGGIDRIQYRDYAELKDGLTRLMEQQFGSPEAQAAPGGTEVAQGLAALQAAAPELVRANPGILMGGIASQMGVTPDVASIVVKPHVADGTFVTRGNRRGTRYYLPEDAPPEDEEPEMALPEEPTEASRATS